MPLLTLAWSRAWSDGSPESVGGPGLCHFLASALDWIGGGLAVLAALGWWGLHRARSSHRRSTAATRRLGAALVAGVSLFLVAAVVLTADNLSLVATVMGHGLSPLILACTALLLAGLARAALRTGRTLPRKIAG